MADVDITIKDAADVDRKVDTRTVGGGVDEHRQVVVLGSPSDTAVVGADGTNGLDVDVTRLPALAAGDAAIGRVKLTDGTDVADVLDLTNSNPLTVAVVDANGSQITAFSGSGGTSALDDADFVQATTAGTPIQGVYESSPTSVTDGDMGIVGITQTRQVKVSVEASSLDVAHDNPDSGNPVKLGARAQNALPTAVANNDRANAIADLFGRILVAHIDPAMQVHKGVNYTTTQTGAVIWDPTAGKKIAITSIVIGSYGTTAARLILWFGANGDTTYSAGSDQLVLAASFAPSSTSKPGVVFTPATPVYCTTADNELHVTTDAGLSVDIAVEGYEF